jgi:hypothetical protein
MAHEASTSHDNVIADKVGNGVGNGNGLPAFGDQGRQISVQLTAEQFERWRNACLCFVARRS